MLLLLSIHFYKFTFAFMKEGKKDMSSHSTFIYYTVSA